MTNHAPSPPSSSRLAAVITALRPYLILAVVCVLFSFWESFRTTFWTWEYLPNVLQQSARNIVLAVGMSFVIMTAGIDLSVGAILALSGVSLALGLSGSVPVWLSFVAALPLAGMAGMLLARKGNGWLAWVIALVIELAVGFGLWKGTAGGVKVEGAIILCLMVGAGCGMMNGAVVSWGKVPPFITTLGMLSAARGLTLYATDGSSVSASIPRFMQLGQGLPLVFIVAVIVAFGTLLLTKTRFGRYTLAIGGSEQATHLSGVDVAQFKTLAYTLSGICAAVGAVLVTAKFGVADTNAGTGAELDAIAAVVIGGTRLSGGQGSIVGALVGALSITVIQTGLVLIGVRDMMQQVILGAVIVLAVFVDKRR
jgi:ribose/xylose/arabinose/galactoside ABC-type transport system permease subunit